MSPIFLSGFIRKCLSNVGIRLDGRRPADFLPATINISRSESKSTAEVVLGSTRVITVVSGTICAPYPDRPTEGILQLSVDISVGANNSGVSHAEITRYLERSIRDNDTLDTESLCIKSGDKVWMISCEVKLVDYHGGAIDACTLSCIAALKAFRRPEVSWTEDGLQIHHSDSREPLPLALNHSPLAVSLGLFRLERADTPKHTQVILL